MKSTYWFPALLISIALVVAGYFIGNLQVNSKKYDRYVTVKGLSEREVAADLAVWPINIILTGNDLEVQHARQSSCGIGREPSTIGLRQRLSPHSDRQLSNRHHDDNAAGYVIDPKPRAFASARGISGSQRLLRVALAQQQMESL